MLLKIDKSDSSSKYACLATASHHYDTKNYGTILRIGRKNADITFESDKTVSRSHCAIKIVSLNASPVADDEEGVVGTHDEEEGGNVAVPPQNEEERLACEATSDGMIAVIQDLGSKFGTTVTYEKDKSEQEDDKDQESDSDDETDDEEVIPQMSQSRLLLDHPSSQAPGVATAPSPTHTNCNTVMKKIEKNSCFILTSLSLPASPNEPTNIVTPSPTLSKSRYTITVQCGSAIVRMTRVVHNFCISRISKVDEKRLRALAPQIGATIESKFDPERTTHLLASANYTSAKCLCVWIKDLPVVSFEYFDELVDRKQMDDDMPDSNMFVPTEGEGLKKKAEVAVGLGKDPTITTRWMAGFKVLSLSSSENELLCQCAGATIVRLYRKGSTGKKLDRKFWMTQAWWDELFEERKRDGLMIVWLNVDKYQKEKNFIKKVTLQMQNEDECTIHCIQAKDVAASIADVKNLVDVEGKELVPIGGMPNVQNIVLSSGSAEGVIDGSRLGSADGVKDGSVEGVRDGSRLGAADSVRDGSRLGSADGFKDGSAEGGRDGSRLGNTMKGYQAQEQPSIDNVSYHEEDYEEDQKEKIPLPSTKDGWMVIAPKSKKKRKLYKRNESELAELGEEFLLPPAETGICKNLVVRSVEEAHEERQRNELNRRKRSRNAPDFKKFKKNFVIHGSMMHSISGIKMRSETPKESAKQRELSRSMKALEALEKEQDALFHVEGRSQSVEESQSILSFFKSPAAATNKGRGGRRRKR